ncbi:Deoxyribonuclease-2-alpha [Pseudolycoriella hygida]|uniref:Deoxyribonuclease-2-alpha n=1 Tax=Pseudolycoriella hygida TaxID=35572 RepID=A0A9Q0S3Z0_9DIPT|nr:Deoxyribonuclease-2-alpha [Pseudolycoriella hygida]
MFNVCTLSPSVVVIPMKNMLKSKHCCLFNSCYCVESLYGRRIIGFLFSRSSDAIMNVKFKFSLLIIFALVNRKVTVAESADVISCKDENGNSVDWFYAYKLPATYNSNDRSNRGLSFLYITATSADLKTWSLSDKTIDDPESLIGKTLLQSYVQKDRAVVAYNDEPPTGKAIGSDGHTKGVVVADENSGFWLIHSVPLYPNYIGKYSYPESGRTYGQSFLCISVNSSQVDVIGKQLIYNEPDIYLNITSDFSSLYPFLHSAVTGKRIEKPPFWNDVVIKSSGGTEFRSFAKNRRFRKELYEDWVAQVLNTNLYVETWRHGTGIIPSDCPFPKKSVWNISAIKMEQLNFDFNSTKDHSKWAVSAEPSWICVGDINRAEHQKIRGGGTVCQQSIVSEAYAALIKSTEPCAP